MDSFYVRHFAYLFCIERLTSSLILYHLKSGHANTSKLILICLGLFYTYCVPKELCSNSWLLFTFILFQQFLKTWCVKHRLSSAAYPLHYGRAELTVKATEKIVNNNMNPQDSLDNDKVARAILQYCNTSIQGIGLSPAQLFHHQLHPSFLHSQFSTGHILNG